MVLIVYGSAHEWTQISWVCRNVCDGDQKLGHPNSKLSVEPPNANKSGLLTSLPTSSDKNDPTVEDAIYSISVEREQKLQVVRCR